MTKVAITLALILSAADYASAAGTIIGIAVYPNDIRLDNKLDYQKFIVVASRNDGVTIDVTKQATVNLANAKLARLDGRTLYPLSDGNTTLFIEFQGHKTAATVSVKKSLIDRPISFHLDVMPVFMRAGCNTGSCHGSSRGKDGFRLSIFGFDPNGDYDRITRELGARRINLAVPTDSLMLEKSIGAVPHTGGKLISKESEYYKTMLRWLEAGAPADKGAIPKVVKLEVFPPKAVLEGKGTKQQFIARAHYDDGTDRDVTSLAAFMTNNDNVAPVDKNGLATAAARGEAFIMARFDSSTVGSQLLTLPKDLKYAAPKITGNYIDQLVGRKLNILRITPSPLCTDEEFLRRATIDITGHLPTEEEYLAFAADQTPKKRAALVDRLLKRKEFSEIWAMKWAELLTIKSSNQVSYKSTYLYHTWVADQVANNVPLDKMVRELLSASGGTFSNPATNYYELERNTLKRAENVAQVFMGFRTQCAQCHNHPFDRWTMDDYYSFAGFFSQIGRKVGEDYREIIIYNRNAGDVRHIVGGGVLPPKFLGGAVPDVKGKDRRAVMAEWLTSPKNPYFATSVANRIWAHFNGVGIVEPVDDIRVSNPASNPELFATLGNKLVEYKYDFKRLVRDICNSQAYQRSTKPNENNSSDTRNFSHGRVRRIQAEMLLDCLSQATETKDKFRGLPVGSSAVQIADGKTSNYFLSTFGRAKRETVCACEANTDPTLSQALHMINGETIQTKLTSGGLIKRLLAEGKKPPQVVEMIYVRCLSRKPTPQENQKLLAVVAASANPQQGLEDVFWAVLNSREFMFNH